VATTVKGKTFTAPRCRILLDGKTVGRGTNVTIRVATEYADIDCIDSLETLEFAPVGYKVTGTIGKVKVVGTTPKSEGFFDRSGKTSDEHLLNLITSGYRVLQLLDKVENQSIAVINSVVFESWDLSVAARGVAALNMSWKAIRETDESETSS
jgi:hypothetical protein